MKRFTFLIFLTLLFSTTACQKDPVEPEPEPVKELTDTQKYFKEVALMGEFSGANFIKKWKTDMNIFVQGDDAPELEEELEAIVAELNDLIDPIEVNIVDRASESNYIVFFGSGDDYVNIVESAAEDYVASNWGLFWLRWDSDCTIYRGTMYVDIYRATDVNARKHLLREELTQSLGLMNDSYLYDESIFQQNWTLTTEYAPIDKELIQLLYRPELTTCMEENEVNEVLRKL